MTASGQQRTLGPECSISAFTANSDHPRAWSKWPLVPTGDIIRSLHLR